MDIVIVEADYKDKAHARDIIYLTDLYACDVMGGEQPLSGDVKKRMIEDLKNHPTALTFLAYVDGLPTGIANCFIGYSTFEAGRLINIHDLAVAPKARGQGIGEKLLEAVQKKARELKCCKITLEVRIDNPAANLYERFGFETGDPPMWFMSKEFY